MSCIVEYKADCVVHIQGTDIVYLDVFNRLLQDGRLNPELTLDDLHLNGKGYSILTEALKQASGL